MVNDSSRKKANQKYNKTHRKELNERLRLWRLKNPEKAKAQSKRYYDKNKERLKAERQEYLSDYYQKNKEKFIEKSKKWAQEHPTEIRLSRGKHKAKERKYGFSPLNKPFKNAAGHHINEKNVIYIPKELHEKVFHCVDEEYIEELAEMNDLAWEYYWGD